MADVFVSYAREDQARVATLVALLEGEGWSVFWDRRIPPGETWRSHIGRALEQAGCVVVAWSEHSVRSDWVIEEAEDAAARGILVPVRLDPVLPPLGFRKIQAADLNSWRGGKHPPVLREFLEAVARMLGRTAPKVGHAASQASAMRSAKSNIRRGAASPDHTKAEATRRTPG